MVEALLRFAGRLWDEVCAGWDLLRGLLSGLGERLRSLVTLVKNLASEAAVGFLPGFTSPAAVASAASAAKARPESKAAPVEASSAATSRAADDTSDETALARMLASEDPRVPVKTALGWLTIQQAQARKQTVHELLTRGHGYGPQDRRAKGQSTMYASTAEEPTKEDRTLARVLLTGGLLPSFAIQQHQPGRWVARGAALSDEKLLEKQNGWHQGIYGRIAGTLWYLFSPDAPKRTAKPGQTARQVLDAVPEVAGMDGVPVAAAT